MNLTPSEQKLIESIRKEKNTDFDKIFMVKIVPPGIYQLNYCKPKIIHTAMPSLVNLVNTISSNKEETYIVDYNPIGTVVLYDAGNPVFKQKF